MTIRNDTAKCANHIFISKHKIQNLVHEFGGDGGGHDENNDAKNKILGLQSYFLCWSDKLALTLWPWNLTFKY